MKLIGLLCWYDEDPAWLAAAIIGMHRIGVDHLIAVDGAYALFPEGKAMSGPDQHRMIVEACHAHKMGLTLHLPPYQWLGNEVEKRTFMFRLGDLIAEEGDWYFVCDADHICSDSPVNVKEELERTDLDCAEISLWERHTNEHAHEFDWPPVGEHPCRCVFRAIPGLHMDGNHYTVTTPDGRRLWGSSDTEPALDLTDVRFEHRTQKRAVHRKKQALDYYRRRDDLGVELGTCDRCPDAAVKNLPTDWERLEDGNLAAGWTSVCPSHALDVRLENDRKIRSYGLDPATVTMTHRKVKSAALP